MRENRESHAKQQQEGRHLSQESIDQRNTPIKRKIKDVSKYILILSSLLILGDIFAEQWTYPLGNSFGVYFAYFALPFFISSVFIAVYVYSHALVKITWKNKGIKLLSIFAGIAYAVFYIFATDLVGTPSVPMPPDLQGFISTYQVYDHLSVWPSVFFWAPKLNLVGDFSVGGVIVTSSLAVLTAFAVGLLAQNVKSKLDRQSAGSFAGSFAICLSTSASGCCMPVILPALFAFFGLASTTPLAEDIAFQASPVFNLLWIGNIWLLLASVFFSSRKFDTFSRSLA